MSRHDGLIRLRHMLDAARKAVELARGRTPKNLAVDEIRVLAFERLFEILGEAASQTTPRFGRGFQRFRGVGPSG